ncbi:MAG: DNA polymerase III subunit delta [Marinilabiliaceae bacterium]|nr:DNA polymerase III subunit delta [Marinilabiliaceae bacterium]
MQFSEIIGQSSVKQRLLLMYEAGRIPHALLLTGPEGTGALPLAISFAQYINCTGDKTSGDSCGRCPSCVKYKALTHPDLHFVYPVVKGSSPEVYSTDFLDKWRELFGESIYFSRIQWISRIKSDKQGAIFKDDVVALHQKLGQKSVEAPYKVLIMWLPELMNETAANRILKILEEPPSNSLFILVSENENDILPTVLSRTQRIQVSPIDDESICQHINRLCPTLGEEQSKRIAHISMGSMIRVNQVLNDNDELKSNIEFFANLMRSCYRRDASAMVSFVDSISKMTRDEHKNRLQYCIHMIRESLVYNLQQEELSVLTNDEESFLKKFAVFIHPGNVFGLVDQFNTAIFHIERNGNSKIIYFDLMMQVAVLLKIQRE